MKWIQCNVSKNKQHSSFCRVVCSSTCAIWTLFLLLNSWKSHVKIIWHSINLGLNWLSTLIELTKSYIFDIINWHEMCLYLLLPCRMLFLCACECEFSFFLLLLLLLPLQTKQFQLHYYCRLLADSEYIEFMRNCRRFFEDFVFFAELIILIVLKLNLII